ncbi:MAG: hypothetical protein ACRY3E_00080 [Candidatus Lariskella arthropodorum]
MGRIFTKLDAVSRHASDSNHLDSRYMKFYDVHLKAKTENPIQHFNTFIDEVINIQQNPIRYRPLLEEYL